MLLICYKKCSTCREIEKIMTEKNIEYTYREIDQDIPTKEELTDWIAENKQPISKWLNTSGIKYREMNLAQKRKEMSDAELIELISTDGMLIKRPILIDDNLVLVGPQVKKWLTEQV